MHKKYRIWFACSCSDNRKSKSVAADKNPKWLALSVIAFVLAVVGAAAEAQQPTKIPRIGRLIGSSLSNFARAETFRQALREIGYVEGENIVIEWRSAEEKLDHLPALAAELVRLKVDIIVTGGSAPTRAAKEATSTIPIVMIGDNDPVGSGLVASLARPGGNITGLSALAPELSGKRLELLKETIPKLTRVAVFGTSTQLGNAQMLTETEHVAAALNMTLQYLDILNSKGIETAFQAAGKSRAEAVLMLLPGRVGISQRTQIVSLAVKKQLPVIYNGPAYVEAGGLMSYGVSRTDLERRAATYIDKILKGAKPSDLPVEQPKKFELIANLKAAKQIGLTIPPNVLARADKVIK